MTKIPLGGQVLGLAAVVFAVISFVWGDFCGPWQHIQALGNISHHGILVYAAAAIELLGGIAIQSPKTARTGALALAGIFFLLALLWVPRIIAAPIVYDRYANFFEQFSIVSGALMVYATASQNDSARCSKLAHLGYLFFGICLISFTLEQLVYLPGPADFVPKWIPAGQMFWAITTTMALALAAVALLSGRVALLASRLLTIMLIGFGLLAWRPAPRCRCA